MSRCTSTCSCRISGLTLYQIAYYYVSGRARRGTSGALYPQSAIAGSNSPSRSGPLGLAPPSGDDGWVPHGGSPRTPPGPGGSNGKRSLPGVVG